MIKLADQQNKNQKNDYQHRRITPVIADADPEYK